VRALWRVVQRLTRPQLAEEVLRLVGMQGVASCQQQQEPFRLTYATEEPSLALSPLNAVPASQKEGLSATFLDERQEQQQLQEERERAGEAGDPSKAELAEAGFQLVRDFSAARSGEMSW